MEFLYSLILPLCHRDQRSTNTWEIEEVLLLLSAISFPFLFWIDISNFDYRLDGYCIVTHFCVGSGRYSSLPSPRGPVNDENPLWP